jgi:hypothetical protein
MTGEALSLKSRCEAGERTVPVRSVGCRNATLCAGEPAGTAAARWMTVHLKPYATAPRWSFDSARINRVRRLAGRASSHAGLRVDVRILSCVMSLTTTLSEHAAAAITAWATNTTPRRIKVGGGRPSASSGGGQSPSSLGRRGWASDPGRLVTCSSQAEPLCASRIAKSATSRRVGSRLGRNTGSIRAAARGSNRLVIETFCLRDTGQIANVIQPLVDHPMSYLSAATPRPQCDIARCCR